MCHPHGVRDNYNYRAIPKRGAITDKHDIKSSLYEQEQTALSCFDIYPIFRKHCENNLQFFENM